MKIALSKLSAHRLSAIVTMPLSTHDAIAQYHGLSHCSIDVGDDYAVGLWNDWHGKYWVLEHATGLIQKFESIGGVKDHITLGRQCVANRLRMEVKGLDFELVLVEMEDCYETRYGSQVARFMDFKSALKDFLASQSHALALKGL